MIYNILLLSHKSSKLRNNKTPDLVGEIIFKNKFEFIIYSSLI